MYAVSHDYLDLATNPGRVYSVQLIIESVPEPKPEPEPEELTETAEIEETEEEPVTVTNADLLSMKIVRGQTTGYYTPGTTVCTALEAVVTGNSRVKVNDRVHVQVRFGEGESASEWLSLGYFYVDSIKQGNNNNKNSKTIVAYDVMLQFSRIYDSELQYPASVMDVLNEISEQTGVGLSENMQLFNDVDLSKKPRGNAETYYTRRDTLGYIAGINGGGAYIDVDGMINVSVPTENDYTIEAGSVIKQSVYDTDFSVQGITWNTMNQTLSVGDKDNVNTLDVYSPLPFVSHVQMLDNMEDHLMGLAFDSVKIKKQGTGVFQLGDLVNYQAPDDKMYRMLIIGIVYEFTKGFFFETLYSMAQSASQQRNQGNKQGYVTPTYDISEFPVTTFNNFAYTKAVHFREDGFILDFVTIDGQEISNDFEIEEVDGKITKLKNLTTKKEVEITYE